MAVAFDLATVTTDSGSVASTTFSHTCTGSDLLLLVGVAQDRNTNDTTVSGVTYNGVALTLVNEDHFGFIIRTSLWRLIAPATGAHDVVVSYTSTVSQARTLAAMSFTGAHQTTALRTHQAATGTNTGPTITYTNGQSGDLIVDWAGTRLGITATVGADQTQRVNSAANPGGLASTQAGAASVVMDWSATFTGSWRSIAVGVIPSGTAYTLSSTTANYLLTSYDIGLAPQSSASGTLMTLMRTQNTGGL